MISNHRILLIGLVLLPMLCPAQSGDLQFVVQAGMMTSDDFHFKPTWVTGSIQLAVHLNDFFFISPECCVFVPDLKFKPNYYWAPGVTANYKFGNLFLGVGLFRWIEVSNTNSELIRNWQIKSQIGLMKSTFCITLFSLMEKESVFKQMKVGLVAGIVL